MDVQLQHTRLRLIAAIQETSVDSAITTDIIAQKLNFTDISEVVVKLVGK